jgi:hypothetical protein
MGTEILKLLTLHINVYYSSLVKSLLNNFLDILGARDGAYTINFG